METNKLVTRFDNYYYTLSAEKSVNALQSSENGLTDAEAGKRLSEFGFNDLHREKKFAVLKLFLSQIKNAFLLLLVFAGALSLFLGDMIDAFAIFGIVLLNALLGFIQEYRAEKEMEALKKISAPIAKVVRNGTEQKIPARELVPGDIIVLESGDIVPADARLLEIFSLKTDEASLTGESLPSEKMLEIFKEGTSVADQKNMIFMGTIVTYGKGRAIVTSTGMKTEFGKIAKSLETTEKVETPLQIKFEKLAKQLSLACVVLILVVLIGGTIQKTLSFGEMVISAIALTVAVVPNSLPIIVTIGLSRGTKRLAAKNMLIKKLPAAESLGSATIIVTDKTGTVTKNQMTVTDIFWDSQKIGVTGTGYAPEGNFYTGDTQVNPKNLELLLRIGYLCNNAKLERKDSKFTIRGDPTEGALVVLGKKGGIDDKSLRQNFAFIEELPFDADRKMMSVIFKNKKENINEAYVKGAPDLLLKICDRILENGKTRKLTSEDKKRILRINYEFAEKALRVLGLAYKETSDAKKYTADNVECNLIFAGLAGMIDPPRDGVKHAVAQCHEAGIKVMIVTGDHAITSRAIACQIGLFQEGDIVLTGDELVKMSDTELERKIENVRIVARALPIQKLRIVSILQKKGHVVAMTGDGVNDAPALKKADISIAMGITGTDVAKEVADATLLDDNFATIVHAIEEGRNIYDTVIKSTKYLLACNTGEIVAVFMAIMMNLPIPLLPLQLLMINLLTDDFPAVGLGFETADEGVMSRPPRNPKETPISRQMFVSILMIGLIMGLGTLFVFIRHIPESLIKAQTMAFTALVIIQMFAVISSRSLYPSLKKLNPFSNKWLFGTVIISVLIQIAVIYIGPLQVIFKTTALAWADWAEILAVSVFGFVAMEIGKFAIKPRKK